MQGSSTERPKPDWIVHPSALTEAAAALGAALDVNQLEALDLFVGEVRKWNAAFNLVSRQDVGRLWSRHVLDSLSVLPLVREHLQKMAGPARVLDAGTGAGFPGLPLAIAAPDLRWVLADRSARKIRFLDTVIAALGLGNAETWQVDLGRGGDDRFPVITSRAMGAPADLVRRLGPHLEPGGTLILLTGAGGCRAALDPDGREDLGDEFCRGVVRRFEIPGLDRSHEVTIIRHTG